MIATHGPYDRLLTPAEVDAGDHRRMIGGMWDVIGRLQCDHLVTAGLTSDMRLLDVGCGALRGGIHLVRHLDAGNYYGIDLNPTLLVAGWNVELARTGLQYKVPRDHLLADGGFDVGRFGVTFDLALAHSLFTHLPFDEVCACLRRIAGVLVPGGRLFATFYECPDGSSPHRPITHAPGGITTFADANPYHVRPRELIAAGIDSGLTVTGWGQWGHPRAQRMMCFEAPSDE